MIVLHVHSGNLYGGVETVITTLVRETDRSSVDHHVALAFEGRFADGLRQLGAEVHPVGEVRLRHPLSVRAARKRLRGLVSVLRPEVLVTHLPWTHAVFGPALRSAGCPLVEWVHGPLSGGFGALSRFTVPDAIICNSRHTAAGLPAPYRDLRTRVILNPVSQPPPFDAQVRLEIRRMLQTRPDDTVVIQASRLEAGKGHREHLRALARLRDVPGWVLWVIGGPQRAAEHGCLRGLHDLVEALGIRERVRFAGEQQDVAPFLAAADVYCQPNTGPESFGLTYVEAMLAGLPVIASDIGALREVIASDTGIFVTPGNVAELAEALHLLIIDRSKRAAMSRAGSAHARALSDPRRQVARANEFLGAIARTGHGAASPS